MTNKNAIEKVQDIAKNAGDAIKDSAGRVGDSIKNFVKDTGDKMNESRNEHDEKKYGPLTKEQLESKLNELPKMIHIMEVDKHKKLEACKDAVAYLPKIGFSKVLEIERSNLYLVNAEFFPNKSDSLFYKNPYNPNKNIYINITEYFDHLKKEKISELVRVANSLGAKHVKIVFQEEKSTKTSTNVERKKSISVPLDEEMGINANSNQSAGITTKNYSSGVIASEATFEGSEEPIRPELIYYKNVSDVEDLINMCMDKKNRPKKKEYLIRYNSSLDINASAASDIDAAINKLGIKMASSFSIKSRVERENKTSFRYLIEF